MQDQDHIHSKLKEIIQIVIGAKGNEVAIGGVKVERGVGSELKQTIADALIRLSQDETNSQNASSAQVQSLCSQFNELKTIFGKYYSKDENIQVFKQAWESLMATDSREQQAKIITHLFLPELNITEDDIVKRWKLTDVKANPQPIQVNEVVIQLNALYSPPLDIAEGLPSEFIRKWDAIKEHDEPKCADYDHPVPLFVENKNHELLTCLEELNEDIAFEKSRAVFPDDYRLPLLISVSVTHRNIDDLCGEWISHLLKKSHYQHLKCFVITESSIDKISKQLFKKEFSVFSVIGKYAVHFNALKYMQLIMEKAYGIRAGFKLDTDEGIRSKDLYDATGKTWFQTLCHELWGGSAKDIHNQEVYLGINEGEYVNKKDIDELGFKNAMRCPDVSVPSSYQSDDIFFNKAFAHGTCTRLYNQFNHLQDHISHPVVKGGGYGITNEGLRRFVPFSYTQTGRAEDQQFYFCSLTAGCRGIFHPDLRIAHYKSSGGFVAAAERRTKATRFIGDMFRVILFSHLVECLPDIYNSKDSKSLKYDLDPMPGVFAGKLARLQAYLNLLYKAYSFCENDEASADILLNEGLQQIKELQQKIDSGEVKKDLVSEKKEWGDFIQTVDALDHEQTKKLLCHFAI